MRTITINIKYDVGDKVWIMWENLPTRFEIERVTISGGYEDKKDGATSNLGLVTYTLPNGCIYREEQLFDTFEQLRDSVFNENLRNQ